MRRPPKLRPGDFGLRPDDFGLRLCNLAIVSLLVITVCSSCGGGGSGSPTAPPAPVPPPTPAFRVQYSGSGAPGADSLSWRQQATELPGLLRIELRATDVHNLYGVAFDLLYPNQLMRFERAEEGTVLDGGGASSTSFLLARPQDGVLVIGLTRLGSQGGFDGSGALLVLELSALRAGTGTLEFDAQRAIAADGRALPAVRWIDGSLTVE